MILGQLRIWAHTTTYAALLIGRKGVEVDKICMCLCLCVFVSFLFFVSVFFPLWISRKEVEVDSKRKEECWQSPPHSSWWLDYSVWGKNCHQGLGQRRRRRSVAQSDAQSVAQREEGEGGCTLLSPPSQTLARYIFSGHLAQILSPAGE